MGWGTAIGEGMKFLNAFVFTKRRAAKKFEAEKQEALRKAEEIAHGDNAKKLEDYISDLPH